MPQPEIKWWAPFRPQGSPTNGRQFVARLGVVGKPGPDGVSPRGWVIYAGLGQCQ